MTPVSAHDVAAEIRRRVPTAGTVKVHKLLYFAQGLYLAWTGQPLFTERIAAWANGPVVTELWADEKHGRGRPEPRPLDAGQTSIVEYVVAKYGKLSGEELIRLTHSAGPWCQVRELELFTGSDLIRLDMIERWFQSDDAVQAQQAAVGRLGDRLAELSDPTTTVILSDAVDRVLAGEVVCEVRPS